MKTISGRIIKVSSNESKRTFTIRTDAAKYRTSPMTKDEFQSCENYTGDDWQNFLNRSGGYYKI